MKSNASWKEEQRLLGYAKALAEFANLKSEGIKDFRTKHPDFLPDEWWDYRPLHPSGESFASTQWQMTQGFVQDAWQHQFQMHTFATNWLLTSVFAPEDMDFKETDCHGHPPFASGLDILDLESYPYHEAVQWLLGQSWRVKICLFCKKCFIAEHPKRRFCTFGAIVNLDGIETEMPCFWAHRKAKKHDWWNTHKKSVNTRRQQEYRLKKKRSPAHAKRKDLRKG